jgi:hypothetical protein
MAGAAPVARLDEHLQVETVHAGDGTRRVVLLHAPGYSIDQPWLAISD